MTRFHLVLASTVLLGACGKVVPPAADAHPTADAAPAADAPPSTYTNSTGWSCASSTDCEDVYDLVFTAPGTVSVKVSPVSTDSMARLAIFAGTATTGKNLFNNTANVICGSGQGADVSGGPLSVSAGHYQLAVGRDWGFSLSSDGTYTVTVTANTP